MTVVRHQWRKVELLADAQQVITYALLNIQTVVHELEEVVITPVDVLPHRRGLKGLTVLAKTQTGLHITRRAPRGADDAVGMFGDELRIHARPLTKLPLVRSQRRELEQIAQAGRVFCQHRLVQVRTGGGHIVALLVRGAPQHALLIQARLRRQVGLDANDRLHTRVHHLAVKRVRAEHITVVSHTHCGHALAHNLLRKHVNFRHAVEHRKLGVVMQVDEGRFFGHALHLIQTSDTAKRASNQRTYS